jgi:hypothetical protein
MMHHFSTNIAETSVTIQDVVIGKIYTTALLKS